MPLTRLAMALACVLLGTVSAVPAANEPAPVDILKKATIFAIGPVGIAGVTSVQEKAFRSLLDDPMATTKLRELAAKATPAGQLYGLLGLKLKKDPTYQAEADRLARADAEVSTMAGCILSKTTAKELVQRIGDGKVK